MLGVGKLQNRDAIDFGGQVVIVTGAGQGLGEIYARDMARRHARIVVNDLPGNAKAEGVTDRIRRDGGEAIASCHSISTPEGGEAVVEDAIRAFGRIDALVNNAGVMGAGLFEDLSPDVIEATIGVNLAGVFHIGQPVYREMIKAGAGRIVNVSSGSIFGFAGATPYGAAKAGILSLTKAWAAEAKNHGIKVNALLPASASPMTTKSLEGPSRIPGFAEDKEWNDAFASMASRYDPVSPSAMVTFLASADCPFSGEILTAIAGRYARVALAVGSGWVAPADDINPEAIRDNVAQILGSTAMSTPALSREYFIESAALIKKSEN